VDLRTLGFKVADYVETTEFLSEMWHEYINGKCSIKKVIDEYNKHGFQANQDIPGNMYWEELFNASPNAKVILTVRDSTEVWNRSLINFMRQECARFGNPGFWLFHRFSSLGWTSPKMLRMVDIVEVDFFKEAKNKRPLPTQMESTDMRDFTTFSCS
jgi:hypothetical protein